ncbi:MAG: hypothetical protein CSA96_07450 [Bacteroidetes bacterium]|nr:MAG: hypothetical protein CSA96_07450 [Bacteroidota bacterium]
MVVDHICFAVKNLEEGIQNWENLFAYRQMTEIVTNSRQKVKVVFLTKENSLLVKLIEPCADNPALQKFVAVGGGFHHLCFKCDEIEAEMKDLKQRGAVKLVGPQPGEAFDNENIAFMLARFGLNFELIDTDKKAALL